MAGKIKFQDLNSDEQSMLVQLYGSQSGYTQKKILYVEEVDINKQFFFSQNDVYTAKFFVQKLYKFFGHIVPIKFNLALSKFIEKNEIFRANFCRIGKKLLKVVFENRNELPTIVYRNLSNVPDIDSTLQNILEADMRQSYDVRFDNLIKFSVFRTDENEYAILVTQPLLIAQSFDLKDFFRSVINPDIDLPVEKNVNENSTQNLEAIKNYWNKTLQNLPPLPKIPFSRPSKTVGKQNAYKFSISPAIVSDIRQKSQDNKIMMMSFLQAAWAIILQEFNDSYDVTFSALIPDKRTVNINSIPIRLRTEDEMTIHNIVDAQFKQILISQPYSWNNFLVIYDILQSQNKSFDHFLSFSDFLQRGQSYSEAEAKISGNLIFQNSWGMQNQNLGMYFHYNDNVTSVMVLYDANFFHANFGDLISKRFLLVLQQMLLDWKLPYEEFLERLRVRTKAESVVEEDNFAYLQNFISQLEFFQSEDKGIVQKLVKISKLTTYFEGDRIGDDDIENNLFFVAEGKLVRSLDTGDGWYNTLDILKENSFVNETVFLENRKSKMSAEVLTERAVIMSIPLSDFKKFLQTENPTIGRKFFYHALAEMEKYQRLWIQA